MKFYKDDLVTYKLIDKSTSSLHIITKEPTDDDYLILIQPYVDNNPSGYPKLVSRSSLSRVKNPPEVIPGQIFKASPIERVALLTELLEFVESVPVYHREDARALYSKTTVGKLKVTHSNTLVMYYDQCDEELQKRIATVCDVESYELLN